MSSLGHKGNVPHSEVFSILKAKCRSSVTLGDLKRTKEQQGSFVKDKENTILLITAMLDAKKVSSKMAN